MIENENLFDSPLGKMVQITSWMVDSEINFGKMVLPNPTKEKISMMAYKDLNLLLEGCQFKHYSLDLKIDEASIEFRLSISVEQFSQDMAYRSSFSFPLATPFEKIQSFFQNEYQTFAKIVEILCLNNQRAFVEDVAHIRVIFNSDRDQFKAYAMTFDPYTLGGGETPLMRFNTTKMRWINV